MVTHRSWPASLIGSTLVLMLGGCAGEPATSPPDVDLRVSGGSGPTVKSAVPDSAPRNTRLIVRVLGSGFDNGSRAVWALAGDTTFATTRIVTNATTFVGSTELRADISIGAEAPLQRYDIVVVTAQGKKGIGIERFTVTYERIDLGTLGGSSSQAEGINDNGQIVGISATASGAQHVFVWTDGVMRDLGPGYAEDINIGGVVTGYLNDRAVVWRPLSGGGYGPPADLGALGNYSAARAINDQGQVTGESGNLNSWGHAFFYSGTTMADIHTLAGGNSFAWGLNGLGHVVGQWNDATSHSFLWTPTTGMRLLPTLGGTQGVALDVNDAGQVVGWSEPAPGQLLEAFLYESGVMTRLGTLGAPGSVATGVNQLGQVVGRASVVVGRRSTGQRPFLWTAGGGMRDLGVPKGSNFGWAVDINSSGAIAGYVQTSSGVNRATLWRLRQNWRAVAALRAPRPMPAAPSLSRSLRHRRPRHADAPAFLEPPVPPRTSAEFTTRVPGLPLPRGGQGAPLSHFGPSLSQTGPNAGVRPALT